MSSNLVDLTSPHYVALQENIICKCGGRFSKKHVGDKMGFPIIRYCKCGNRIVIGYGGKIYEK